MDPNFSTITLPVTLQGHIEQKKLHPRPPMTWMQTDLITPNFPSFSMSYIGTNGDSFTTSSAPSSNSSPKKKL
jgi:hypothetical protein